MNQNLARFVLMTTIGIFLPMLAVRAGALWTPPANTPPDGTVLGPLSTGPGSQTKQGGDLLLGNSGSLYAGGTVAGASMVAGSNVTAPTLSATQDICLNGSCITSWSWK